VKATADSPVEPIDFEEALHAPAAAFGAPEHVLDHPGFSPAQKIEILRHWANEASALAVAEEEGMPSPDDDLFRRALLALGRLTRGTDVRYVGPSKHHGLMRRAVEGEK
jgi:hypothetical protein